MTKEDKELLAKDLCARIPYNVIVHRTYIWGEKLKEDDGELEIFDMDSFLNEPVEKLNERGCTIKPYLRPMSSMTEEENKDYKDILYCVKYVVDTVSAVNLLIDWLNSNHFDYRGLIEKGLALPAPDGMYNVK